MTKPMLSVTRPYKVLGTWRTKAAWFCKVHKTKRPHDLVYTAGPHDSWQSAKKEAMAFRRGYNFFRKTVAEITSLQVIKNHRA